MSFQSKRELLMQVIPRYRESRKKEKTTLLNEFIANTGYTRKYAVRLLSSKDLPDYKIITRSREPRYGAREYEIIKLAWAATNFIGAKRLAPFLKELVPCLERHGYINLDKETRQKVITISASTIDRLLKHCRHDGGKHGISTTKSGTLLKNQIPVRTFSDWNENRPGFFEGDLVAHCGYSMSGSFLYTFVLTDVATGWTECLPLLYRSQEMVIQAMKIVKQLLPFKILGLDTDNGLEFINNKLVNYCLQEEITFTRGRPYKKNDQCFVEQKNGDIVRQIVGYDRFEGSQAFLQLNELYRAIRLYVNFFQPSMKLKFKHREGSYVYKKYDKAKTPYYRLIESDIVSKKIIDQLTLIYNSLDPIKLLQQIKNMQDALWHLAVVQKNRDDDAIQKFKLDVDMPNKNQLKDIATNFVEESFKNEKRKYKRTKKTTVPHTWRTRINPYENYWDEICEWLSNFPERTSKSIFDELNIKYPGQFKSGQLRTLQRYVKDWRAKALLTFNYKWINDELLSGIECIPKLQGKIFHDATG